MTEPQRKYLAEYLNTLLARTKSNKFTRKRIKTIVRCLQQNKTLKAIQSRYLYNICKSSVDIAVYRLEQMKAEPWYRKLFNYNRFKEAKKSLNESVVRHQHLMVELNPDGQKSK